MHSFIRRAVVTATVQHVSRMVSTSHNVCDLMFSITFSVVLKVLVSYDMRGDETLRCQAMTVIAIVDRTGRQQCDKLTLWIRVCQQRV